MDNRTFYYARVSSREQNLDRQLAAFAAVVLTTESLVADIPEKNPPMPAAPDMGGMY